MTILLIFRRYAADVIIDRGYCGNESFYHRMATLLTGSEKTDQRLDGNK